MDAPEARRWVRIALFLFVIPLLIGAGVAYFAGRPIAFDAIRRITDYKFPNGKWVDATELVRWRADPGRAPPVVLDARTEDEYAVSHLQGAVRIDPYKPSLRPLRGFSKDTAIVLYSSVGYRGARVADFLAGRDTARSTISKAGSSDGPTRDGPSSARTVRPPRSIPTTPRGVSCSSPSTASRRRRSRRNPPLPDAGRRAWCLAEHRDPGIDQLGLS